MQCYVFAKGHYLGFTRDSEIDLGQPAAGGPALLSNWGWGTFATPAFPPPTNKPLITIGGGVLGGKTGIDAALYSGSKCYFFAGSYYIRVTRGATGPGVIDPGYPAPISNWGWGDFGKSGIDAALYSVSKCYFFSGNRYIRVTRRDTGPGTVDTGYPKPISNWGWGAFGDVGIDGALYSGQVCYFFAGQQYIRVRRGETGAGQIDPGYPRPISDWGWGEFAASGISDVLYSGGGIPLSPSPPAGLTVTNVGQGEIDIAWTNTATDVNYFEVHYHGSLGEQPYDDGELSIAANQTTAKLTGLKSGYTYTIFVLASSTGGLSQASNEVAATVPVAPTPRMITLIKQSTGATTILEVSGSGFTPGNLIVIKVTDTVTFANWQATATANAATDFVTSFSFPCVSGVIFTVSAYEDANPAFTQSNAINFTC